jgi:predicted CopG family antitoxin
MNMTSISVNNDTKREFDELKPEDRTHDEFVQELLDAYRRDQGEIVNVDELVEQITQRTATNVELAAYRGVKAARKDHGQE